MKKMTLIINPAAGLQKGRQETGNIVDVFCAAGYEINIHFSQSAEDAVVFAEKCPQSDIVVCAGGDGTLNNVLNGVMRRKKIPPIGYIPIGTTNDFASSLKLKKNPRKAAEDIVKGTEHKFDIGKINDKYFTYVASFGAFSESSYLTPQAAKNAVGHLAYVLEGIRELPAIRPYEAEITADGKSISGVYTLVTISNSTSIGGVVKLEDERVKFNDGLFELVLIKHPKNAVEAQKILSAFLTQNYNGEMVTMVQAKEIAFKIEGGPVWSVDGEKYACENEIKISVIKDGISIIY